MKDAFNKELKVGDEVIYIRNANKNPSLHKGIVTKLYNTGCECSVDSYAHVYDNRIMKLGENNND